MISNKYAEDFNGENGSCDVLTEVAIPTSGNEQGRGSRSPIPRTGSFRRSNTLDILPDDYLANRVTFYMDELGGCSNCESDESSPDVRKLQRKKKERSFNSSENGEELSDAICMRPSHKRPLKKDSSSCCKETPNESPDLRRQLSLKKLHLQVSEVLARERSLKRHASWREYQQRLSIQDSVENYGSRSASRPQSKRGSRRKGCGSVERSHSGRTYGGSPRRTSSTRSVKLTTDSRKNSSFSERFDLPHKNLPPKERRRRTAVLVVIIIFLFLVVSSVMVVIVTLTNSTFHSKTMDDTFLLKNLSGHGLSE